MTALEAIGHVPSVVAVLGLAALVFYIVVEVDRAAARARTARRDARRLEGARRRAATRAAIHALPPRDDRGPS